MYKKKSAIQVNSSWLEYDMIAAFYLNVYKMCFAMCFALQEDLFKKNM